MTAIPHRWGRLALAFVVGLVVGSAINERVRTP